MRVYDVPSISLFTATGILFLRQRNAMGAASQNPRASMQPSSGGRGRCNGFALIVPATLLLLPTWPQRQSSWKLVVYPTNLHPMRMPPPTLISSQGRESAEEEICFSLRIEQAHVTTVVVSPVAATIRMLDGTINKVQGIIRQLFWVCHCICYKGIPAHCLTTLGDGKRSQHQREEIHQVFPGAVLGYAPAISWGACECELGRQSKQWLCLLISLLQRRLQLQ
jgi:hypothetical protein